MKQLTSAVLREAATFLAPGERERDIVKLFDVKSFDFHDPDKLSQQYNDEFVSVTLLITLMMTSFHSQKAYVARCAVELNVNGSESI